ncbi:MAG: ThiF family adenylyltransferase [Alcaligenes pakistanensis]
MTLPPLVEPGEPLSREELNRYSRHLLIPNVGMEGQRRIKNAKVLVIGAGGAGLAHLVVFGGCRGGHPGHHRL